MDNKLNPKDSPEFFLGEIYTNVNTILDRLTSIENGQRNNRDRISSLENTRTKGLGVVATLVVCFTIFGDHLKKIVGL